MVETKEKTIDGRQVMVTQFPARKSLKYKIRLIKLFGPSLAQLLNKPQSHSKSGLSSLLDADITSVIEKLSEALDPEQFVDLVLELLAMTRIGQKEVVANFDMEFADNLPLVYKILWFVLEVNYGNFFSQGGIGKVFSQVFNQVNTAMPVTDNVKKS